MIFSTSDYYLAFQCCNGFGAKSFDLAMKRFGSARVAFQAKESQWRELGIKKNTLTAFELHREKFDLSVIHEKMAAESIRYLPRFDSEYPERLKEVVGHPIGLFIKGKMLPKDLSCLAVVGTRKITPYGREVTQFLVSGLVRSGFTIVSGLAMGVDGLAHQIAIDCGGRTIAVLGCGLDMIYPSEHQFLAQKIVEQGALISEYPPGMQALPGNFPARNRIVSGISLGVLVTEGAVRSGSLITAMMAVEQNREVFAVPGSIMSKMSEAPAKLIKMGAKLVTGVDDILEELNTGALSELLELDNTTVAFDTELEEKIWQYLKDGNQLVDDIKRSVDSDLSEVVATLSVMELKGLIQSVSGGRWMRSVQ